MPLFPVSDFGQIAQDNRVTENPVSTDDVVNFDPGVFSGVDTSGIWRIVVWTTLGTAVSDTAGNAYNVDASSGSVQIWSARIDAIPADGSPLTVTNGLALHARLIGGVDPVSYLGPTSGMSGGYNNIQTGASPAVYTGATGSVTLPEVEDLLFGAWLQNYHRSDPGSFFGILTPDPTPGHFAGDWSEQRILISVENSGYPGAPADPYEEFSMGVLVSRPSAAGSPPLAGWQLSVTWAYSPIIIGPFPNFPPGSNSDISWDLLLVAYRPAGVGAIDDGEPPATANDGVDLITSSVGLHRAFRDGTDIKFQTLRWGANDWGAAITIGTDADDTVKNGAAPCLGINEHEDIFCWYHTTAPTVVGYKSEDWGQTWDSEPYASHAGLRYPRIAFGKERFLVALYNISLLDVFESSDGGVTLELAVTFATQPKQRPNLAVDHQNVAHLVWENADGHIVHRASKAPGQLGSWSDPVNLDTGLTPDHVPGYAVGHRRAMALWWYDDTHVEVALLTSNYGERDQIVTPPIPDGVTISAFYRAWPGMVYDTWDRLWLLIKTASSASARVLVRTDDDGFSWEAVGGLGGGIGP